MMNEHDTRQLLGYLQAADNRNIGNADIAFWMETVPGWIDLELGKAAIRWFFTEPERGASDSTWFNTKHLIRCAKNVKRQQETEAARERAKTPAIEAAYRPPAEGWRARVPGGYPEDAEEPAEDGPAPMPTPAQLAENREHLHRLLNARSQAERDAIEAQYAKGTE